MYSEAIGAAKITDADGKATVALNP